MQLTGRPPIGVVFDCDMGARPETALALGMLFALDQKNECRVAAMSTTRGHIASAAYMDATFRYYAGFSPFVRPLPVGLPTDGPKDDLPSLAEANASFKHTVEKLTDTADPYAVIRNAYTAQYDGNAATVLCGPATNLVRTLDLPGAKEWVEKKVKLLVAVLTPERRSADPKAADRLLTDWPSPVLLLETDLLFPVASVPPAHPAAKVIQADVPAGDLAAVVATVRPIENYFVADGKKLSVNPDKRQALQEALVELVSAKPQPRTGPPRRPAV
jgi:hypothetical protein